ncbi:MAG: hypothetical protein Q9175_005272 [Cornicularia normoerica]
MASHSPLGLLQKSPHICPSCARRLCVVSPVIQRRSITQNHIKKTLEGKLEWARQATEIKAGRKESMLTMLEKRGYVNQIIGERGDLDRLLTAKRVGVYVGIDPTAPSMHVGHLVPLMVLYWMYIHGFHACSLVGNLLSDVTRILGGATAQIGDPIGRTTTREAEHSSVRKINILKIHMQLKSIWEHVERRAKDYGYHWEWAWRREVTNNNAWLNKLPAIVLLKLLGSGVRLGTMLGRDTVKNRSKSKEGMSFSEFTYPLLQSWDWWHMYSTKDIQVQVGGSDQFGNILAGIDAINHIRYNHYDPLIRQDKEELEEREALLTRPMGFTVPLLTTSSGVKFGKSEGNAIWLDREMTSGFDLYQFFLRTADSDVHRYLKLFTFEPLEVLETIMEDHNKDPSKRVAQHKLAQEVLNIVHGETLALQAEQEHSRIFKKFVAANPQTEDENKPTDHGNKVLPYASSDEAPTYSVILPKSLIYNQPMYRVLYHAGLVASRSDGQRMVNKKGAYLGARPSGSGTMGEQVDFSPAANWAGKETQKYIIGDDTLIVRVGKSKVKVIKIISDEEFEEKGLSAPGWKEDKPEESLRHLEGMKAWNVKNYVKNAPIHQ